MLAILVESKMAGFEPFLLLKVAVLFLVSTNSSGYEHLCETLQICQSRCVLIEVLSVLGTVKVLWTTLTTTTDSATSQPSCFYLEIMCSQIQHYSQSSAEKA